LNNGRTILVQPNAAGSEVILPLKLLVQSGGPIFHVLNRSGVNTFDLVDGDTLSVIRTVSISSGVNVYLVDVPGFESWYTIG